MKFEYADPRCAECMDLEKDSSGKVCTCNCHSEENPYLRYHTSNLSFFYILYVRQSSE